jgi:hypothetical protein
MNVPLFHWLASRFAAVVLALGVIHALGADKTAPADSFYSGRLADGRAMQLLVRWDGRRLGSLVQLEGNPYSIALDFRTNSAGRLEFAAGYGGDPLRQPATGLSLATAALPARVVGQVSFGQHRGVSFTATNVAKLEKFSRKRGRQVAGRGGGKSFTAEWPAFHDGVPFHQSLAKRLADEAKGEASSFVAGGYGIMWEGLKDGGQSWNWEGSVELRIVWLATNLVSLCELRYEFTGGAHGNAALVGRNFALQDGQAREFRLADLFRSGVNWTNALADLCLRELRRQKAAWTLPDAPTGMQVNGFTAADLASFNVDGRGLIIHFGDYTVAPHSDGLFSVLIPWQELAPLLKPGGPAALLLRGTGEPGPKRP